MPEKFYVTATEGLQGPYDTKDEARDYARRRGLNPSTSVVVSVPPPDDGSAFRVVGLRLADEAVPRASGTATESK